MYISSGVSVIWQKEVGSLIQGGKRMPTCYIDSSYNMWGVVGGSANGTMIVKVGLSSGDVLNKMFLIVEATMLGFLEVRTKL